MAATNRKRKYLPAEKRIPPNEPAFLQRCPDNMLSTIVIGIKNDGTMIQATSNIDYFGPFQCPACLGRFSASMGARPDMGPRTKPRVSLLHFMQHLGTHFPQAKKPNYRDEQDWRVLCHGCGSWSGKRQKHSCQSLTALKNGPTAIELPDTQTVMILLQHEAGHWTEVHRVESHYGSNIEANEAADSEPTVTAARVRRANKRKAERQSASTTKKSATWASRPAGGESFTAIARAPGPSNTTTTAPRTPDHDSTTHQSTSEVSDTPVQQDATLSAIATPDPMPGPTPLLPMASEVPMETLRETPAMSAIVLHTSDNAYHGSDWMFESNMPLVDIVQHDPMPAPYMTANIASQDIFLIPNTMAPTGSAVPIPVEDFTDEEIPRDHTLTPLEPTSATAPFYAVALHPVPRDRTQDHGSDQWRQHLSASDLIPGVGLSSLPEHECNLIRRLATGQQTAFNQAQEHLYASWSGNDEEDAKPTFKKARGGKPPPQPKQKKEVHISVQYRLNRTRTIRKLMGIETVGKEPEPVVAETLFPSTTMQYDPAILRELIEQKTEMAPTPFFSLTNFEAVMSKLRKKSPGPDKIDNAELKRNKTKWPLLLAICNAALHYGLVPDSWLESETIFLGKPHTVPDGKTSSHYRPISLQCTSYKLFSTLLCNAITPHINMHLSEHQKGFRGGIDGCHVQNYLLRSLVHESSCTVERDGETVRQRKQLLVALLDLKNAYGSISHTLLHEALRLWGIDRKVRTCIQTVYHGHRTRCKTSPATVRRVHEGLLQGDPLSPILANLFFNTLLSTLPQFEGADHSSGTIVQHLAFADDILLLHNTPAGMTQLLDSISRTATTIGIRFNDKKSEILVTEKNEAYDTGTYFSLQGNTLHSADDLKVHRYLGVPYDNHIISLAPTALTKELLRNMHAVQASALLPWQKLDAMRTFIQTKATFAFRECGISSKDLRELTDTARNLVHNAISNGFFPTDMLHLPIKAGGTGVWDMTRLYHMSSIVGALAVLNSKCPTTRKIARWDATCAPHLVHHPVNLTGTTSFKKGSANIWARYKQAVLYFHEQSIQCSVHFPEPTTETGFADSGDPVHIRFMDQLQDVSAPGLQHTLLLAMYNQHALVRAGVPKGTRLNQFLNSPATQKVISNPIGLTTAGWQYHWQARHFQLSSDRVTGNCMCGQERGTAHENSVACPMRRADISHRHNNVAKIIQQTIIKYKRSKHMSVSWEQRRKPMEGMNSDDCALKPDLTVTNATTGTIFVLDVAISCDPERAFADKALKYRQRAERLQATTRYRAQSCGIIITPWGTMHPQTQRVLQELGMDAWTTSVMLKRIIESTLNDSGSMARGKVISGTLHQARDTRTPTAAGAEQPTAPRNSAEGAVTDFIRQLRYDEEQSRNGDTMEVRAAGGGTARTGCTTTSGTSPDRHGTRRRQTPILSPPHELPDPHAVLCHGTPLPRTAPVERRLQRDHQARPVRQVPTRVSQPLGSDGKANTGSGTVVPGSMGCDGQASGSPLCQLVRSHHVTSLGPLSRNSGATGYPARPHTQSWTKRNPPVATSYTLPRTTKQSRAAETTPNQRTRRWSRFTWIRPDLRQWRRKGTASSAGPTPDTQPTTEHVTATNSTDDTGSHSQARPDTQSPAS